MVLLTTKVIKTIISFMIWFSTSCNCLLVLRQNHNQRARKSVNNNNNNKVSGKMTPSSTDLPLATEMDTKNTSSSSSSSQSSTSPPPPSNEEKNVTTTNNNNNNNRVPYKQLCHAAGSKNESSLEELKSCIESGWTANDIDKTGYSGGKSALHFAAWKGSLSNIKYLLEVVGCDINSYSMGQYSYGKTAIFFAATQSRVDIVEYLLDNFPTTIKVNIINNKGQSPLSICSSHDMPIRVIEKIKFVESSQKNEKSNDGWWNFRKTHSDGLEYGDLDPRFIDRPIRNTDIVTELAINPTTTQSRKGSFARRNNKQLVHNKQQEAAKKKKQQQQQSRRHCPKIKQSILNDAIHAIQQHQFWNQTIDNNCYNNEVSTMSEGDRSTEQQQQQQQKSFTSLIELIEFADQFKCAWMSFMAEKLVNNKFGNNKEMVKQFIRQSLVIAKISASSSSSSISTTTTDASTKQQQQQQSRNVKLLEKLLLQIDYENNNNNHRRRPEEQGDNSNTNTIIIEGKDTHDIKSNKNNKSKKRTRKNNFKFLPGLAPWMEDIQQMISLGLNISLFEDGASAATATTATAKDSFKTECNTLNQQLVLTELPIFVNTYDQFHAMKTVLHNCRILSIDTEWYDKKIDETNNNDHDNNKEKSVVPTKDDGNESSNVIVDISTIQISAIILKKNNNHHNHDSKIEEIIVTYVVDLLYCQEYNSEVQEFIRHILENDEILILGFAIGNDLPHLERFCFHEEDYEEDDDGNNETKIATGSSSSSSPLRCQSILDLQQLLVSVGANAGGGVSNEKGTNVNASSSSSSISTLPGLKACVSQFTDVPLSKTEQCSDWSQRPLTESQLNYAGMDAAILLVLLVEHLQIKQGLQR